MWYKYRSKEDDGFCKVCIKKENEKLKEIKLDDNRNYTYNCKTNGCEKGLILQKTDYCKALYCRKCFDMLTVYE